MINYISILLGLAGTILIFFFGVSPAINSEGYSFLAIGVDADDKAKYLKYKRLSQLGLILLILSFLFQLFEKINLEIKVYDSVINTILLLVTATLGYYAYVFSRQQTLINKKMLEIHDYVEIFVMPRKLENKMGTPISDLNANYLLLIKNASYYPIYLQKYILNGKTTKTNDCVIPNVGENWYQINIASDSRPLNLEIYFEDYTGKKYKTLVGGTKSEGGWSLWNKKKEQI